MRGHGRTGLGVGVAALAAWGLALSGVAQTLPRTAPKTGAGRPVVAERAHRTPTDWRFAWPGGDPGKGRDVFAKLECHSCHEVRGERFPAPTDAGRVGPELSVMGPLHEAEYFAEAIIHPSAVIERGKGYEAADGSSKMPSYNDAVTVQEVIDLVAYLRGLKPSTVPGRGGSRPGGPGGHPSH